MMQKLRRTRRPPARPECHPWIVTRLTCELQTSTKKTRRPGRCWSEKGTEGLGFSIGRRNFFPRGKCRITVLGRIMTLPKWSFMEWQRTSRVVLFLYFICNFRTVLLEKLQQDMNVDVDDKIKNDNIKDPTSNAFCTMSMLFWFACQEGLEPEKPLGDRYETVWTCIFSMCLTDKTHPTFCSLNVFL